MDQLDFPTIPVALELWSRLPAFGLKAEMLEALVSWEEAARLGKLGNNEWLVNENAQLGYTLCSDALATLKGLETAHPFVGVLRIHMLMNRAVCAGRLAVDMKEVERAGFLAPHLAGLQDVVSQRLGAFATENVRSQAFECMASLHTMLGKSEEALEALERAADTGVMRPSLAMALLELGSSPFREHTISSIYPLLANCKDAAGLRAVKRLLNEGLRPNQRDCDPDSDLPEAPSGDCALEIICRRLWHVHIDVLSLFLDAGADPNEPGQMGATPLMIAARVGHVEGCRRLLAAGADINASNSTGMTPLMMAVLEKEQDQLLQDFGRVVPKEELQSEIVIPTVEFLLSRGAKVNQQAPVTGACALHFTAASMNAPLCRILLDAGADVTLTGWGTTEEEVGVPTAFCAADCAAQAFGMDRDNLVVMMLHQHSLIKGSREGRLCTQFLGWLYPSVMLLELLKLECAKEVEAGGTGGLRLQAKMLVKQLRELMEPGDFSSNPLLQAHLRFHANVPEVMRKQWASLDDMTEHETNCLWRLASWRGSSVPVKQAGCGSCWVASDREFDLAFIAPVRYFYSFGIPNEEALETIAAYSHIVELGAGTGYWASFLAARGVDVVAYDKAAKRGEYVKMFFPVLQGDADYTAEHADRALLMVWPLALDGSHDATSEVEGGKIEKPGNSCAHCGAKGTKAGGNAVLKSCTACQMVRYCSRNCQKADWKAHKARCRESKAQQPWDVRALQAYKGEVVIYVGEWRGQTLHPTAPCGASSSAAFQAALEKKFRCVKRVAIPNWLHHKDDLSVWVRKAENQ